MNNATAVNRPGYAKKKLEKAGRLLMMLILISFAAIMLLPFFGCCPLPSKRSAR